MRLIERGDLSEEEYEKVLYDHFYTPLTEEGVNEWRMFLGLPYNRDLTEQEIKTQYELRHKNDL